MHSCSTNLNARHLICPCLFGMEAAWRHTASVDLLRQPLLPVAPSPLARQYLKNKSFFDTVPKSTRLFYRLLNAISIGFLLLSTLYSVTDMVMWSKKTITTTFCHPLQNHSRNTPVDRKCLSYNSIQRFYVENGCQTIFIHFRKTIETN